MFLLVGGKLESIKCEIVVEICKVTFGSNLDSQQESATLQVRGASVVTRNLQCSSVRVPEEMASRYMEECFAGKFGALDQVLRVVPFFFIPPIPSPDFAFSPILHGSSGPAELGVEPLWTPCFELPAPDQQVFCHLPFLTFLDYQTTERMRKP